ncbi:MAG: DUF177 domain-containing protein [Lachnospiraceae bacterium]|nr:DUF177 domain-containing protein [Lachnospiraceae bacterium]
MIVDLTDVCSCENKAVTKEVTIDTTSFQSKLGTYSFIEKKPFELHLVNEGNKRLLISGETDVMLAIPCDRCLELVPTEFHLSFDRTLPLEEAEGSKDEEDEREGYMTGFHLDADRLVCNEILINWPMKVLCRADCRGICKKCGTNLNLRACDCTKSEPDPRMAAIQDVFNKFKEV